MLKLKKDIEGRLYLKSPAYFGINGPPYSIKMIKKAKHMYSSSIIYELRFKGKEGVILKQIKIKKCQNSEFKRLGGVKQYYEYMRELESFFSADQLTHFGIPKMYDYIESPTILISEYIIGKDCRRSIFNPLYLFKQQDDIKALLKNIVDFIIYFNKYDKLNPYFHKLALTTTAYAENLRREMEKEPFIFLNEHLKKEIITYLEYAEKSIENYSYIGPTFGDTKPGNFVISNNGKLYIIDLPLAAGIFVTDITELIVEIYHSGIFNFCIEQITGRTKMYVETILQHLNKVYTDRIPLENLRFYLFKKVLNISKFYFIKKRAFWPLARLICEKELTDLLSGQYAGVELKNFSR